MLKSWERMLDGVMYSCITVQHLEVFSFNELTNTLFINLRKL